MKIKTLLISSLLCSFILNAQCWKTISAKGSTVAAIQTDGSLWLWGNNADGQLGDGTTLNRSIPTQVEETITSDWDFVTTGTTTLAIKKEGSLWGWGSCEFGQLANDSDVDKLDKLVPIRVGTKSDWVMVQSTPLISFGIKKNGTLWAWGVYAYAWNSNLLESTSPVVEDTFIYQIGNQNDWQSISAGDGFVHAIKTNGTLWAYGDNEYGTLGNGTNIDSHKFIQIGNDNNWKSISSGGSTTVIGLKTGGELYAWGSNVSAAFGNGTKDDINSATTHNTPIRIGNDKWLSASTSGTHTLAVSIEGGLWTWGISSYYSTDFSVDKTIPHQVGAKNNWKTAMTTDFASLAMLTTGSLYSWGNNIYGVLGGESVGSRFSDNPYLINCGCSTIAPSGVSNQSFCNGAKLSDIKLSGTTIKWYDKPVGGFLYPSTSILIDGQTYYASQTFNECESPKRLAITVSVTTVLEPKAAIEQTFCSEHLNPKLLSDLAVSGTNLRWYDTLTAGTILPGNTALFANKTYYVCSVINGCESTRLGIKAIDLMLPPTGETTQTFCAGSTLSEVKTNSVGRRWYTVETGGFSIAESTLLVNNNTYYASESYGIQGEGFCESTKRLSVKITLNTTPSPTGQTTQTLYNKTKISDIVAEGSSLKFYDAAQGGNLLNGTSLLTNDKKYYISQTIGSCESLKRLEVLVYLTFTKSPTLAGNTLPVNPQIKDVDVIGSNLKWYASLLDFQSNKNQLSLITYLQKGTTYFVTQTVDGFTSADALQIYYDGISLSLDEFLLKKENNIISPNPTKTYFIISNPKVEKVEIYSLDGKLMIEYFKQEKYNIENLAKGIYLVKIRDELREIKIQKLIKQ